MEGVVTLDQSLLLLIVLSPVEVKEKYVRLLHDPRLLFASPSLLVRWIDEVLNF
jgi:hypothetical protein